MKRLISIIMLLVVMCLSVSAVQATSVKVHAVDQDNNDLEGVVVAPEWKRPLTGWNDFLPKERITHTNGYTSSWAVLSGTSVQVNYATLDGYTCTSGVSTRITTTGGNNVVTTVCTQNEVPEFGTVAAFAAVLGGLGIVAVARRH